MRFIACVILPLTLGEAFGPASRLVTTRHRRRKSERCMTMDVDMQPPSSPPPQAAAIVKDVPSISAQPSGAPTPVRYSEFVKLVRADRIEKVTFSSDGTQLMGVDADGVRIGLESLPNDPDLLSELTSHKVRSSGSCGVPSS